MGYWVGPGHLPEAIDVSDLGGPESEISTELTRIAHRAILHSTNPPGGPIRTAGPLRPVVEIPDRTFADEDSIVAGFAERPTELDAIDPAATERTHIDRELVAALRKQGRMARRTSRAPLVAGRMTVQAIQLPTDFAPAPRAERPAHADPPAATVLPPNSLGHPHVQWEPTAGIDASLVTSDLELDLEDSAPEPWPSPWPSRGEPELPMPINHSRPAPLDVRYADEPSLHDLDRTYLDWILYAVLGVVAMLGVTLGILATILLQTM